MHFVTILHTNMRKITAFVDLLAAVSKVWVSFPFPFSDYVFLPLPDTFIHNDIQSRSLCTFSFIEQFGFIQSTNDSQPDFLKK